MKLGTTIFLLVIILIAFGYVTSDDQHVRKDLKETTAQLANMNSRVIAVNQELTSCQKARQDDQSIISAQKAQILGKDGEIGTLKAVLAQQTVRITQLESETARLAGQTPQAETIQATSTWLPLDPTILIVLLAVQLVWFVLQRRQKNGYVRLSAEERGVIIKLRRAKKM